MTDPTTGAIVKAGFKATGKLGKHVFDVVNGSRSSVKMERAIAEELIEEGGEGERRLEAAAIANEVAPLLLKLYEGHRWNDESEHEHPTEPLHPYRGVLPPT